MRKSMFVAALLCAVPALAVPTATTNFKTLLPSGITNAEQPGLAGTVAHDELVPFSTPAGVSPAASGTIQVRTVKNAAGQLSFYWKINVAGTSQVAVRSLSVTGFPQVVYDANWRKDGLGTVAPTSVFGTAPGGVWRMGFEFLPGIQAGESSRFLFLKSSATATKPATAMITLSNNISIQNIPALAPK